MRFIVRAQVVALAALAVLLLMASAGPAYAAAQPGVYVTSINGIGPARNYVTLGFPAGSGVKPKLFAVSTTAAQDWLTHAHVGDRATVEVDDVTTPTTITKIDSVSVSVDFGTRVATFLSAAVVVIGIAFILSAGRPWRLLIGADNRLSNSQVQLAMWSFAVATVYLSAVWLRAHFTHWDFIGGVGLTNNLIILTGLSAISFGGAKAIAVQKAAGAAAAQTSPPAGVAPAVLPARAPRPRLLDLFRNGFDQPDLGDLQMIVITVLAAVIFVLSSFHFLGALALSTPVTLPDVDSTLLATFGIGQGAYLFKKAALPAGQG